MSGNSATLAERRERLIAQAAAQRRALVQDIESWRIPLALADQGLTAVRNIRAHPEWLIGVVLVLAVLRPRRVGRWLGRGWVSWQVMRRLRSGHR